MRCSTTGLSLLTLLAASHAAAAAFTARSDASSTTCRCIPGDECWPAAETWQQLNATVGGRLIATSLLAEVCHDPHYDAAACEALRAAWDLEVTHFTQPAEFMAPLFQNQSCDPFTPQSRACTLGNYVSYAIDVSGVDDVVAGIKFAQDNNIRLVIKNTGHDYLGKSTGKGALSIWTHSLKSIEFTDYNSSHYTGKAVKMGAGVQGWEAYDAAKAAGLAVVGGECPTVGVAGGFTSGGGHSSLSSLFGLAADNALEWEVVTADGRHLVATPIENSDLYWALSGGGAGTFAVVLSLTSKAYDDMTWGGVGITVYSAAVDTTTLWSAVEAWLDMQLKIVDAGGVATWYIFPFGLFIGPIGLPGMNETQVQTFIAPYLAQLADLGVTPDAGNMDLKITSFDNFHDHYFTYNGPYPYGTISASQVSGGRLLPRSAFANVTELTRVGRALNEMGFLFGGFTLAPTLEAAGVSADHNAVLPAWRDAVVTLFTIGSWNFTAPLAQNLALQELVAEKADPLLKSVAPDSGVYLNEANFLEPEWKKEFYGANYDELVRVKRRYDPDNFFYAVTAVGSDSWAQDGEGRLCRVEGDVEKVRRCR